MCDSPSISRTNRGARRKNEPASFRQIGTTFEQVLALPSIRDEERYLRKKCPALFYLEFELRGSFESKIRPHGRMSCHATSGAKTSRTNRIKISPDSSPHNNS